MRAVQYTFLHRTMTSTELGVVPAPELNGLIAPAGDSNAADERVAPSLLLLRISGKLLSPPVLVLLVAASGTARRPPS